MRYIIMCGGRSTFWDRPKHLTEICGEPVVARTIRLLKEAGVEDIAISSHDPAFLDFGVPVLIHENTYYYHGNDNIEGYWFECFYPTDEPTCYIFGDVVFSAEAIETIVSVQTDDIMLFGSAPPFADNYPKQWKEPFALKVVNTDHLKRAIEKTKELDAQGVFWRNPIMWELWHVITGIRPEPKPWSRYVHDYVAINDFTCDIDCKEDVAVMEELVKKYDRR